MGLKTLTPRLATAKTARVPVLQPRDPNSWRGDKTSAQRGYGYRWQKERADYLRLYPLCRECERSGFVKAATVVDHIEPHRGDQALFWDRTNWQPLCGPCHTAKTAAGG